MVRLIATLLAMSAHACHHAAAQVPSLPYTFTAAPVSNQSTGIPSFQTTVQLLNPGIIGASYLTVDQATGLPYGSNGTLLLIDIEGMAVQSVRPNIQVKRGSEGTQLVRSRGACQGLGGRLQVLLATESVRSLQTGHADD